MSRPTVLTVLAAVLLLLGVAAVVRGWMHGGNREKVVGLFLAIGLSVAAVMLWNHARSLESVADILRG